MAGARITVIAPVLAAWWLAAPAAAQQVSEATIHFEKGVELFHKGDFEGALVEFRAAYEIEPHYKVRYNIGVSLYELNRYLEAREELEAYLHEGGQEIPEDRRTEIKAVLFEIMSYIGQLEISCDVDGAEVRLAGQLVGTTPLEGPLVIDVGEHVVEIRAQGYQPYSGKVSVPGGTLKHLEVELVPAGEAAPVVKEEAGPGTVPVPVDVARATGRKLLLAGEALSVIHILALPVASVFYVVDDRSMKTYLVPTIAWGTVLATGMIMGAQLVAAQSLRSMGVKEPRLMWEMRAAGWAVWGVTVLAIGGHYLLQGLYNHYDRKVARCPDCEGDLSFRKAFATATHFWSGLLTGIAAASWILGTVGWMYLAREVEARAGETQEPVGATLSPWVTALEGGAAIGLAGAF